MGHYVARRLVLMIPTLLIVAVIAFSLMRLVPGNTLTAQIQSSGQSGVQYNSERLQQLKQQLGIEGSIPTQFVHWGNGILHGNFGKSFVTNQSTLQTFTERLPVTIELGVLAILFSLLFGIPIGVISATRQNSSVDYGGRLIAILLLAVPNFWLALLIVVFAARLFGFSFPNGSHPLFKDPVTNLKQFVIPALVIAASSSAVIMRLARTSMLEILRNDFVRTARAKGLRERNVVIRHAFRNAIIPIATVIGAQITTVIAGAVVIEQIFNLRGVGLLTLTAVNQRDYPQVQTNVLVFSAALVMGNFLTDLAYAWLDPRIRYG